MTTQLSDQIVPENSATVRRLSAEGIHWRVVVESWRDRDTIVGRLVFEPDTSEPLYSSRHGMPMLRGESHQEVVLSAHDLTDARLREVLHSLR